MAFVLLLTSMAVIGPRPSAQAEQVRETGRVFGADRIATSVAISQRSFPSGAAVAYLARADVFADALAAGTLTDGPVLLVPRCAAAVPQRVADELQRLDPGTVLALGGTAAVCDDLLALASAGRQRGRVAGSDRYQTAIEIARRGFPSGADEVYLASAADSPDAVAGGSLTGGPILLVPKDGAPPGAVADEVARLGPSRVVALGGTAAVADDTVLAAASGRPTLRLAGRTRYETAAKIAEYQFGPASPAGGVASTAYLARGDVFADAVAAGSLQDGPVLLVPSCNGLPDAVAQQIARLQPPSLIALGGGGAVCDATLGAAGEVPGAEVVIPDTTVVMDATAREALQSDEDGVLVFAASGAPDVAVGDVLVSYEVPVVAPQGLLRRVTSVTPQGSTVAIATEPAGLMDAVHDGDLSLDVPLTRADLLGQAGPVAARQAQAAAHLVQLDELASVEIAPGVTLTGELTFDASMTVDVDVDYLPSPHLDTFTAALDFDESADITLTAEHAAEWAPEPRELWEGEFRCFWTAIGPVPISLCPEIEILLTANGSVEGRITMGASQAASARFGIEYADGDWSPINERSVDRTFAPPSLEVNAAAAGGVRAELGLEVYDLAGPYVWGTLYVRGEGAVADSLVCWGLYAGLSGGVGADVDDVLGDDVRIPDLTLGTAEILLAEYPVPHDACDQQGSSWRGTVWLEYDEVSSGSGGNTTAHAEAVVQLNGVILRSGEYQGDTWDEIGGSVLSASEQYSFNYESTDSDGPCQITENRTSGALAPNADFFYMVEPSAAVDASVDPLFAGVTVEYYATGRYTNSCEWDPPIDESYTDEVYAWTFLTSFEKPTVTAAPGGRRICDTITSVDTESFDDGGTRQVTVTATFELADGNATPNCG